MHRRHRKRAGVCRGGVGGRTTRGTRSRGPIPLLSFNLPTETPHPTDEGSFYGRMVRPRKRGVRHTSDLLPPFGRGPLTDPRSEVRTDANVETKSGQTTGNRQRNSRHSRDTTTVVTFSLSGVGDEKDRVEGLWKGTSLRKTYLRRYVFGGTPCPTRIQTVQGFRSYRSVTPVWSTH